MARLLAAPLWALAGALAKQELPDLERAKDDMRDKDIVLEGDNTVWMRLPRPFFRDGDARPFPPRRDYSDTAVGQASRVFVLVASLSETKVGVTLLTMFRQANRPDRVFAGVVQQNNDGDPDALEELCRLLGKPLQLRESFRERPGLQRRQPDEDAFGHGRYTPDSLAACEPARRVRMFRMDASEAKGPAYARSHQPRLLDLSHADEDFCLQIDAHTVFVRGWDSHLLQEWTATANEYAVLTTYPMSATRLEGQDEPVNDQGRWCMPHLCKVGFQGSTGAVVRNSIAGAVANLEAPALTKFWAAGLSFGKCHVERDVPNDPQLRHIFSGEEFSRAARLWTNGYDMYSMMRPYVVTYYGKDKGGRGGWRSNRTELRWAEERMARLLRSRSGRGEGEAADGGNNSSSSPLKGYDLGTRRSYEDNTGLRAVRGQQGLHQTTASHVYKRTPPGVQRLTGVDTVNHRITDTPCAVARWQPWRPNAQPPFEVLRDSPGATQAALPGAGDAGRRPQRRSRPAKAHAFNFEEQPWAELTLGVPATFLLCYFARKGRQQRQAKST